MATEKHSAFVPTGPVPFEDFKAGLPALAASEQHREEKDELFSTLPSKMFGDSKLFCYKGFWLPDIFLKGAVALEQRFAPRPDDVIVASFPKCGTTWVIALTVATMMQRAYPANAVDHPLRRLNPHQCLPFLEYVCREPKDMVVSLWHYHGRISPGLLFQDVFQSACDGTMGYGPFWEHFPGYWGASITRPDNVLFFSYEQMLHDPVETVRRLAHFVGQPFSAAEVEAGIVRDIVELCSLENFKSMEANKTGYVNPQIKFPREALFRKGVAGDWKNYMTMEMASRLDEIIADRFHHTGLTFQ